MYCRICGGKIEDKAKFCNQCGKEVKVVKLQSNNQNYTKIKEIDTKKKTKREKKLGKLKNPYIIPAFTTAIIAFGLGIFPWPVSWRIGTSLPMKIVILIIALLSDYYCTKAIQVNRLYNTKYRFQVKPKMVKIARIMASVTTIVALFALIID